MESTVFPDMLTEMTKIEKYIQENFGGRIHATYGCSMGGSFTGLLIQRRMVHIAHGILGSSDLDRERGISAKVLYGIFQKGCPSRGEADE